MERFVKVVIKPKRIKSSHASQGKLAGSLTFVGKRKEIESFPKIILGRKKIKKQQFQLRHMVLKVHIFNRIRIVLKKGYILQRQPRLRLPAMGEASVGNGKKINIQIKKEV